MRKLDKKTREKMEHLAGELRSLHETLEEKQCAAADYAAERSDRWHESEAGYAYLTWVDELESLLDSISCISDELEDERYLEPEK